MLPILKVTISKSMLYDKVGYTPYEGREVTGWPTHILNRGRLVIRDNQLQVERGSGVFLKCEKPDAALPLNNFVAEMDPLTNFGANILGAQQENA